MASVNLVIWKLVEKMYKHYFSDNELKIHIQSLNLSKKYDEKFGLINYFLNLSEHESLVVIQDVLQIPEFWLTDYDKLAIENNEIISNNANSLDPFYSVGIGNIIHSGFSKPMWKPVKHNPPEHREWALELIRLLNLRGIIYNRTTNNFILRSKDHEQIIGVPSSQSDLLIKSRFEDYFYSEMIDEINGTFHLGYYIATVILIRKLFENMILDLLKDKFPPTVEENRALYFINGTGRPKDFKDLIDSLALKQNELDDGHGTVHLLLKRLKAIKDLGNKNAHKLTHMAKKDDITNLFLNESIALILRLKQ